MPCIRLNRWPATALSFAAMLCAGLLLLAGPAHANDDDDGLRTVTVSGEGTAAARPDMAEVTAGVVDQAESARAAMTAANAQVAALISSLQGFGIADRDIETSRLNLQPVYPRQPRDQNTPPAPVAFRAENSVTVRLRDIDRIGDLLDLMLAGEVNRINGIRFAIAEPAALLDRARREAMADARRRAALYAEEAGAGLGRVLAIQESTALPPRPMMRAAMAAEAAPAIAPGESEVRAVISVTFALR